MLLFYLRNQYARVLTIIAGKVLHYVGMPIGDERTKMSENGEKKSVDIYEILLEAGRKRDQEKRAQLLQAVKVKEFFQEGKISIDMKTCKGVECKLCIKACPTNALYWKSSGEIGIIEELCVYCTSCVLNCIVDKCIDVKRKRPSGEMEQFDKPYDVNKLLEVVNTRKRMLRLEGLKDKILKPLLSEEEKNNAENS